MGAETQLVCSQIIPAVLSCPQLDINNSPDLPVEFSPNIRSGSFSDIGPRKFMEDQHVRFDDLSLHLPSCSKPSAFYGVFDGHGGPEAAVFLCNNVTRFFFQDVPFHVCSELDDFFHKSLEESLRRSFLLADSELCHDSTISTCSGTTALTALVLGKLLLVANAGDCRAVLCRKGEAIDMSQDHRPTNPPERRRVEELGGFIDDGYLNGVLSVTRALGDWDIKGSGSGSGSGSASPLTAEPELRQIILTEDDEFLIIGCDGIWDVMSSQQAVSLVRRGLRRHDNPDLCAEDLVKEALRLHSVDNLTVIVVCFSSLIRQREESESESESRPRRLKFSLSAEALSTLKNMLEN